MSVHGVLAGYALVKAVHVGAVLLSGVGFFARGLGRLRGARWVEARALRVLPHAVDTILLLSALALAWMLQASPLAQPWLAAKIAGVFAYIGLGMGALRPGGPRRARAAAWLGALLVYAYVASVALTKDARGFFALAG